MVHRDLKPDNFIYGEHGILKIIDFGISISIEDLNSLIKVKGNPAGTKVYMSPECKLPLYGNDGMPYVMMGKVKFLYLINI